MTSYLISVFAQTEPSTGSDWNWVLYFLIFVVILVIALVIQARYSARKAKEFSHEDHHPAEETPPAALAVEPESTPGPELEPEPEPEPEVAAVPAVPIQPDDLKQIEGIGPKVASLLNENGIATFAQLAETPVESLVEILEAHKLQMMNPASWPQQAKLAALADWEALQKLQDSLKGGR